MAHNDSVSVTIVTYNSGRFIKRCLESVKLAQRYPHTEIIIVDNASTDGTIDILEQFDDRCQVYYNDENVGFKPRRRIRPYKLSSGDWVLTSAIRMCCCCPVSIFRLWCMQGRSMRASARCAASSWP